MKQTDRIEIDGQARTAREWADLNGIQWGAAKNRVNLHGWPIERAVTEPPHTKASAGRLGKALSPWNGEPLSRNSRPRPKSGALRE